MLCIFGFRSRKGRGPVKRTGCSPDGEEKIGAKKDKKNYQAV